MITNYILGEIVDFDILVDDLRKKFRKKVDIYAFGGTVLSSHTQGFTYKYYKCNEDKQDELNVAFSKIDFADATLARSSQSIGIYELTEEEKLFEDKYFEFALALYPKLEFEKNVIGIIYFAIDSEEKYIVLNEIDQPMPIACIESTFIQIQSKIDLYDKLYYSIDLFSEVLSIKEKFLPFHMTNVANWCLKLSEALEMSKKDSLVLYIAALMHDMGKVYIPDNIINKDTRLTDKEYELMKTHSIRSYEIAKSHLIGLEFFKDIPDIIVAHHERIDGKGYPYGLIREDIPYLSRVLSIADSVDAMSSKRLYRGKKSIEEIIRELKRCSNTKYDSDIVDVMIKVLLESKDVFDISSVVGTNFISSASIAYYYRDTYNFKTYTGNLVINNNDGKLILHDTNYLNNLDIDQIHKASISFYNFNNIYEYCIDVVDICENQFIINNFEFKPLDKYFTVLWDVDGIVKFENDISYEVRVVKLGGDTLILETDGSNVIYFTKNIGSIMTLSCRVVIDDHIEDIKIDGRIINYYNFGSKFTFYMEYTNVTDSKRDQIIRILLKKQLYDRKISNMNV